MPGLLPMVDSPSSASPARITLEYRRRVTLASSLALLWTFFTLVAQFSGVLDSLEQPIVDWYQTLLASPVGPNPKLALVAIDEIPSDRPWPWPRLYYATMLRSIVDSVPDSVVFEMNLYDSDPNSNSFDATFADVVNRANTVIFAGTANLEAGGKGLPANIVTIPYEGDTRLVPKYPSATWALSTFAGNSPAGISDIEAGSGYRCHSLPLVFLIHNKMVPSLTLAASAQLLGADLASSEVQLGRFIYLRQTDHKLLCSIPIDTTGRMQVRFHTTSPASWMASFDNIDVYAEDQLHGRVPEDKDLRKLHNRQVWVGRTDGDAVPHYVTPVGSITSLEVQMQAERTILNQDFIRPLPPVILAMVFFIVAIGGAIFSIRLGPLHAIGLVLVTFVFWVETAILLFRLYNVVLPILSFAGLLFGCYVVGFLALSWDFDPEREPE